MSEPYRYPLTRLTGEIDVDAEEETTQPSRSFRADELELRIPVVSLSRSLFSMLLLN